MEYNAGMRKVYDCFIFNNELDLLEIRLHELWDTVDYFVVSEGRFDFRGNPKPLYLRDNLSRFSPFLDKIRLIECGDDTPIKRPYLFTYEWQPDAWANEYHQRQACLAQCVDASDDDLIMMSDSDEIPAAHMVTNVPIDNCHRRLRLAMFNYNFNRCEPYYDAWACNTGTMRYGLIRGNSNFTMTELRDCGGQWNSSVTHHAGWHFSWFGGDMSIKAKESVYNHTILTLEQRSVTGDPVSIGANSKQKLIYIDAIDHLPVHVQQNPKRFIRHFDLNFVETHGELFA
jgi:beta-1,4-mannosyl-glycoprotein beta-1,4-N-acetylglucosaminyltransferase